MSEENLEAPKDAKTFSFQNSKEPSTITFHAGAFKIGSDFVCLDFGNDLFLNHEKIKTLVFEYKDGKTYTYKKVEET